MLKEILLSISLTASIAASATAYTVSPDHKSVTIDGTDYHLGPEVLLLTPENSSSPYVFNDALKALDAVSGSAGGNVTLLVAPSVYWLDNPDDPAIRYKTDPNGVPHGTKVRCDSLSIIGLSDNPEDVVFAVNRGQTQGAIGNYTMILYYGKSLRLKNMTFGNYCNVDLIYPRDPSLNRAKRRDAIVQAQLGICDGTDRLYADNCRFISRLNLCPFGARRSLYDNCYFECTDDALNGSAVYLNCRFTFFSGKPFYSTDTTGAVFLNCDIHSLVSGAQYLTKAPGAVTMIDTRFTAENPVSLQWTRDESPIRCYQSNVTLNGSPVTIDADRPQLSIDITNSPLLRAYKVITPDGKAIYNTPNLLGGTDGWDPLNMRSAILEAEKQLSAQLLSLPVGLKVTPSSDKLDPQDSPLTVTPALLLWGAYPLNQPQLSLSWSAPSTLALISAGTTLSAKSANTYPRQVDCLISATTHEGLTGATNVKIAPYLKPAPEFISVPVMSNVKSTFKLDYQTPGLSEDDSYVIWYRSTRADHSDSIAVRHGHGLSARTYPLSPADKDFYISASVFPKEIDTRTGAPSTVHFEKPVSQKMIGLINLKESKLSTSFAEVPIRKGTPGRPGFWHFDTYKPIDTQEHEWTPDPDLSWYYGHGDDAATGIGLVQATKGARLSYTPTREKSRGMTLELTAEPSKGPGQGFGSATGQYMDICVKFDPVSLSGYALRIQRTPDYDKAVTFTLVQYTDGKVTPISDPIASNCFRTPCHIKLDINNDTFVATARTEAPDAPVSSSDIKPYVMLTAPVAHTDGNSFMIQHTGSVGASATLLRNLNVNWK